ncbi:aminoglycoside phosphotransferase family protein [Candidatus Parcubacteria bacterium]|nr:aminoglycoside phosphotransferase family protein [Candidatus Parcubacteria bacterium]
MFIKDIDNKIAQILEKLKLSPKLNLVKFKAQDKRFYTTPCSNKQGKKVLLKALISSKAEDRFRIKKEIAFLKAFHKMALGKKIGALKIIKANLNYPQWVLREYLAGKIIGHHFDLYNEKPIIRKQITDNLIALQKIKLKNFPLKRKTANDYLKKINEFTKERVVQKQAHQEITLLKEQFLKATKLINENNNVLCHGDFTLANFFVNKNKLYLTDWELAHLGNAAADIARTYIQTFRYPKWRDNLIKEYLQKINKKSSPVFKELFCFEVAYQAFVELSCNLLAKHTNPALQSSMRTTLRLAKAGFAHLMTK